MKIEIRFYNIYQNEENHFLVEGEIQKDENEPIGIKKPMKEDELVLLEKLLQLCSRDLISDIRGEKPEFEKSPEFGAHEFTFEDKKDE